jgi:hypothetical protein
MTLWQDPPPQTRRQARESERAAQLQAENAGRSRRAGTIAPTVAGQIPDVSTPFGLDKHAERHAGATTPVVRPVPPRYDGASFDTLLTAQESPGDLFHSAAEHDEQEPVTVPVTVVAPPAPARSVPSADPVLSTAPERTLTRRELRAILQAQEANQQVSNQQATQADAAAAPHEQPPVPGSEPAPIISISSLPLPSVTPRSAPAEGHGSDLKSASESNVSAPGYSRSSVSSGSATTSNALIIPTVPSVADAMGPLTSTGEILVTGSIDLPRSLGSTGQRSDRFDSSDIDRLFEQPEAGEQTESTVAPIRASRAVSTHTSTRDVITPRRGYGNKLPTVLAITAAVLALGVIGLLVAGYIFKVF